MENSLCCHGYLTPWDHAPGTLIVQEAGGEVRLRGLPIIRKSPMDPYLWQTRQEPFAESYLA